MTKTIIVANEEDALPVFVRVRAFYPENIGIESIAFQNAEDWEIVGDYYYYMKPLLAGQSTSEIEIKIA